MELSEYDSLVKLILSGFVEYPDHLTNKEGKQYLNRREYYRRKAQTHYFVEGMYSP